MVSKIRPGSKKRDVLDNSVRQMEYFMECMPKYFERRICLTKKDSFEYTTYYINSAIVEKQITYALTYSILIVM